MGTLLIAILSGLGFLVAYHTYGRWLGRKIFNLSADAICPSRRLEDGVDYVPTSKSIVFGHHFTSIAGTGPIVGPAIAIMWGWLPALLWVVLGSIFIGAVHDLGALVVSLRNNGQTVGDIAGRVINRRVRLLFLLVLFLALTIVLAIFGLVIAAVFRQYPSAIFPCLVQIPIAILIGLWLHRKGVHLLVPSLLALGVMYLTVIFGDRGLLHNVNTTLADWSIWRWVVILLIYSYVASVLPVWTLLQPRDYINSLQLITALGLLLAGLVAAAIIGGAPLADGTRPALTLAAPVVDFQPKDAPIVFPFLFITVACGAISGFHCLVSSGTSSKQLAREPDARFVGYGGMLMEGFLATLVITACAAGVGLGIHAGESGGILTGQAAWAAKYSSWQAAGSLGAKVGAFVDGAANFLRAIGVPLSIAVAIMGVLVASFAGTTMDTACRLQRYVIQELAVTLHREVAGPVAACAAWLRGKHAATLFAITVAAIIAAAPNFKITAVTLQDGTVIEGIRQTASATELTLKSGEQTRVIPKDQIQSLTTRRAQWSFENAGKGGLILWPLFGATNQLLGGLAFLVITFHLWRRRRPVWFLILPMIFMLIMPFWAMCLQLFTHLGAGESWIETGDFILIGIALATLALEVWMIIEAIRLFPTAKGVLESPVAEAAKSA